MSNVEFDKPIISYHGNYIPDLANFCIYNVSPGACSSKYSRIITEAKKELHSQTVTTQSTLLKDAFSNTSSNQVLIEKKHPYWNILAKDVIINDFICPNTKALINEIIRDEPLLKDFFITALTDIPFSYIHKSASQQLENKIIHIFFPLNNIAISFNDNLTSDDTEEIRFSLEEQNISYFVLDLDYKSNTKDVYDQLLFTLSKQYVDQLDTPKHREPSPKVLHSYVSDNIKVLKLTAIYRFQLLLITLLEKNHLSFDESNWHIHVANLDIFDYEKLAIKDLFYRLNKIAKSYGVKLNLPSVILTSDPTYNIYKTESNHFPIKNTLMEEFSGKPKDKCTNILFSVLSPWLPVNQKSQWIYVTHDLQQEPLLQTTFTPPPQSKLNRSTKSSTSPTPYRLNLSYSYENLYLYDLDDIPHTPSFFDPLEYLLNDIRKHGSIKGSSRCLDTDYSHGTTHN